jgi:ABC-type Na+ efflux pump permease subunit
MTATSMPAVAAIPIVLRQALAQLAAMVKPVRSLNRATMVTRMLAVAATLTAAVQEQQPLAVIMSSAPNLRPAMMVIRMHVGRVIRIALEPEPALRAAMA